MKNEVHHEGESPAEAEDKQSAMAEHDALVVEGLWIRGQTGTSPHLVADVSFQLIRGQCFALLGESGCGKTLTALSILDLVPASAGYIERGQIRYDGVDLLRIPRKKLRQLRGDRIAMVFQETQAALNPVLRIGAQLGEVLQAHRGASKKEARAAAIGALRRVNMHPAETWVDAYPHELSGGMQQRVLVAMALMCGPDFLLADEPTSSLDVVLQAEMMRYLSRQSKELDIGVLLITHDIALVAEHCQQVMVMYRGTLVEKGSTQDVLENPKHPYTLALLRAHPDWSQETTDDDGDKDGDTAAGMVPDRPAAARPLSAPKTQERSHTLCGFRDSCPRVLSVCHDRVPAWRSLSSEQQFRCWNPLPEGDGLVRMSLPPTDRADANHG